MKLFLDDIRNPPDDSWILFLNPLLFIDWLFEHWDNVTHISLDHDLAFYNDAGKEVNGTDVINRIEEEAHHRGYVPFNISIHSANPVGIANMAKVANALLSKR